MERAIYSELAALDENAWWWFVGRRAIIEKALERHLKPSATRRKVLDAGCGTGGNLPMLERFGSVTGIELSPIAVETARKLAPQARVILGGLPEAIPTDETFDLIGVFDVLEHLEHPVPVLEALRARLVPGGQLFVTVPAFPFLWSRHDEVNHHFRRYTKRALEQELNAAGFEVDFASHYNVALFAPIAAVRLLRKVLPDRSSDNPQSISGPINTLLTHAFTAERHLVTRFPMPFGVSMMMIAHAR